MRQVTLAVALLWPGAAEAQAAELALAVARVAVNEAGFDSPADVGLVWQATEGHGTTHAERLSWLRRHSPCATGELGDGPASRRPGNCTWSRNLREDGEEPQGWPEGVSWAAYRGRWLRVLRLARGLVAGMVTRRPCEETPVTWGGAMDHAEALGRGLVPLRCEGTRNTGFRLARALAEPSS